MQHLVLSLLGLSVFLSSVLGADNLGSVVVTAGEFDRRGTIATFALPGNLQAARALRHDGKSFPLQVGKDGVASFIIDELAKGTARTYVLVADPVSSPTGMGEVTARRDGAKVKFGLADPGGSSRAPRT